MKASALPASASNASEPGSGGAPQGALRARYARSKRSRFITLFQAATKSSTNLRLLSSLA